MRSYVRLSFYHDVPEPIQAKVLKAVRDVLRKEPDGASVMVEYIRFGEQISFADTVGTVAYVGPDQVVD